MAYLELDFKYETFCSKLTILQDKTTLFQSYSVTLRKLVDHQFADDVFDDEVLEDHLPWMANIPKSNRN